MKRRGFTLIEVMAAMAVLTVVLAIVYGTFAAVTTTMEVGREEAERLRERQHLIRTLRGGLESVYAHTLYDAQWIVFEGESNRDRLGHADALTFMSSAPARSGKAMPGDLKQVRFELSGAEIQTQFLSRDSDAESAGRALRITEVPYLTVSAAVDETGATSVDMRDLEAVDGAVETMSEFSVPVQSFKIAYYDGSQDEWFEEWSHEERQRLPWAVRLQIAFPRTQEELDDERRAGRNPEDDPDLEILVTLRPGLGLFDQSQWPYSRE